MHALCSRQTLFLPAYLQHTNPIPNPICSQSVPICSQSVRPSFGNACFFASHLQHTNPISNPNPNPNPNPDHNPTPSPTPNPISNPNPSLALSLSADLSFGVISTAYLLRAARLLVVYNRDLRQKYKRLVNPSAQRMCMCAALTTCSLISLVVQLRFAKPR